MTMTPEEEFRMLTAKSLGRIETRGERNEAQLTALNNTVAAHGERISRVESIIGTMKVVVFGGIALIGAGVAAAAAFLKGD